MRDLQNPKLMWLKAILLLFIGLSSGSLLLLLAPSWQALTLLALCVWGFCRAYYFTFYVIEHYIDPGFKFAGLMDLARWMMRGKKKD